MWLAKDERRILAGYYTLIGEIGTEKVYRLSDLRGLLRFRGHRLHIPEYGEAKSTLARQESPEPVRMVTLICDLARVERANTLLQARNLITVVPHECEHDVVVIGLTLAGYDLGRRYTRLWECTGLWFEEYRNHWFWLVMAAVGGGIVSKAVDWLMSLFPLSLWIRLAEAAFGKSH